MHRKRTDDQRIALFTQGTRGDVVESEFLAGAACALFVGGEGVGVDRVDLHRRITFDQLQRDLTRPGGQIEDV